MLWGYFFFWHSKSLGQSLSFHASLYRGILCEDVKGKKARKGFICTRRIVVELYQCYADVRIRTTITNILMAWGFQRRYNQNPLYSRDLHDRQRENLAADRWQMQLQDCCWQAKDENIRMLRVDGSNEICGNIYARFRWIIRVRSCFCGNHCPSFFILKKENFEWFATPPLLANNWLTRCV